MDRITTSSNATSNSNNSTSVTAKLRRLKIQENILLKNLSVKGNYEVDQSNFLLFTEFKKFYAENKNSCDGLKQLFQDIKARTSSKELIKSLDIDEIKKNTHELEDSIKSLKSNIQTELNVLKSAERKLNEELINPMSTRCIRKKPRLQIVKYIECVPSPVKTLMTSPLKCSEVQEFQEFISNSKNRYGGWDEYHHNIFINLWKKHELDNYTRADPIVIENSVQLKFFLREILPKLQGIGAQEVKSHVRWYMKYLTLKERQQKAIDKWRSNKRLMKPHKVENGFVKDAEIQNVCSKKIKQNDNVRNSTSYGRVSEDFDSKEQILDKNEVCQFVRECLSDRIVEECYKCDGCFEEPKDIKEPPSHLQSTKQWKMRCSRNNNITETKHYDVENVQKLGIPFWRVDL